MIYLYSGTPGSGKSLHVAENIYKSLQRGKNVICNFEINVDSIKNRVGEYIFIDNFDLSVGFLKEYFYLHPPKRRKDGSIIEGQTYLIIDEAQLLFNSRDWAVKDRREWNSFFTQHRKYGLDVILVTQFDRFLDRQIRGVIEYEVLHRKVSNFKSLGFILGLFSGGSLFVALSSWYGMKGKTGKISSRFFRLHKKYSSLYNSYAFFNDPHIKN